MDNFDSPEVKKKYDNCKMVVKVWEHNFKKKHGRVPSKFDIREADRDIRYAYKTYFNIKSAMIEKTFVDVDGFFSDEETPEQKVQEETVQNEVPMELDDTQPATELNSTQSLSENSMENIEAYPPTNKVIEETELMSKITSENEETPLVNDNKTWGAHLNNAKKEKPKEEKTSVNSSFTQKLFSSASKFSKRNPRKSLSFSYRKSDSNLDKSNVNMSFSQPDKSMTMMNSSQSFCQPESSFSQFDMQQENSNSQFPEGTLAITEENDSNTIFDAKVKIAFPTQEVQLKSLNVIHRLMDHSQKSVKCLDSGWIQRTAAKTGLQLTSQDIKKSVEISKEYSSNVANNFPVFPKTDNNTVDNTKLDYDSDDIIEESDDEDISVNHIAKKRKIEYEEQTPSVVIPPNKLDFSNIFNNKPNENNQIVATQSTNIVPKLNIENTIVNNQLANKIMQNIVESKVDDSPSVTNNNSKKVAKAAVKKTPAKGRKKSKAEDDEFEEEIKNLPPRKSGRQRKTLVMLEEGSEPEEEDPFKSDNDSDDPEFNITKSRKEFASPEKVSPSRKIKTKEPKPKKEKVPKTPKAATPAGKRISRVKKQELEQLEKEKEQEEEENATYELEFSIKPRIQTVPRINVKQVLKERKQNININTDKDKDNKEKGEKKPATSIDGFKNKRQIEKEKFEKKIASGNLNDNFVQIDIRKKMYSRGKKHMNFSKYKKQMWKNKKKALAGPNMDMGGCDGGELTCFKCGKTGHFARQCKEKGDTLLPLGAADEEPCPYPTLEEASAMANDVRFVVRKPALKNPEDADNEDGSEGISSGDDDEGEENPDEIQENQEFAFEDDEDEEALLAETLRIEEHVQKLDVKQYLDTTTFVKPYYELKEDGNLIDTPKEVFEALSLFGHTSFREGQERAIMRILSGKSTLVTLSTGSGKSLCYQLPAYLYAKREPCISLIISPLVSLMEDQVTGIPHMLRAACLHTNQTKPQREKIMAALSAGELSILLISPEAVAAGEKSSGFGSLLRKLPPIAFACIDEAHCVSQWSHNFRPSYLMICRILREKLGVTTILGLTATATRATGDSIIEHLQIPDGRDGIISDTPLPKNLRLTVSKDANRDNALLALLNSDEFVNFKSIIIYCIRREECERIASFLRTSLKYDKKPETNTNTKKRKRVDVQAEPYHAGLSASRRRTIQKNFMSNELRIVVATVAFGMGINKTDLRAVIHYNVPKNFESYVQEVGRAGRDGLPAHCHLFLDSQGRDECELRRHIHANSMDRHVIRKLLQRIFVPCACKQTCPKHEVAFSINETVRALDIPEENIATLLCYLELHENRYIEVLSPAYITCRVISYGGPMQIRKAAKDCPPLAMALALHKGEDDGVLEFPVIDVASAIGWDSGICKHILKNLEWTKVNNQPKRSTISVQFINLGFRLLAPGNLSDVQLDEALDSLYEKVVTQEKTALLQLHALHSTLSAVTQPNFKHCLTETITDKEMLLKEKIREYFESPKPLDVLPEMKMKPVNEEQVIGNVRTIIAMYRDNVFTGRAIARIFHGIQSPNYPAVIWGRCRFWRAHMTEDFNTLCKIATQEILKMRM